MVSKLWQKMALVIRLFLLRLFQPKIVMVFKKNGCCFRMDKVLLQLVHFTNGFECVREPAIVCLGFVSMCVSVCCEYLCVYVFVCVCTCGVVWGARAHVCGWICARTPVSVSGTLTAYLFLFNRPQEKEETFVCSAKISNLTFLYCSKRNAYILISYIPYLL